ncbi:MAG: mRNA surveillance protein pelota [Candidatus Nanohaloarchaea archaeon]
MKLLRTDRNEGYAEIEVENRDDLWYLKDILREGDEVRAKTIRTKLDGREKKTCTLTVRIEKVDYQEDRLRLTGEITRAPDDVELGYHTFNLEEDKEFEVWKDFTEEEWERLQEAESNRSYSVLFALVEKEGADFYIVEESGITDLSGVESNIPGKMYSSEMSQEDFHREVKDIIDRTAGKVDHVVLAGPGHQKNRVMNMLDDEVQDKTFLQDTSVTGKTGLHEAIKRGALKKVVESSRISDETSAAEEFFDRLRSDDRVAYGDEVRGLAEQGAVEKLLITQQKMREEPGLAEKVEQMGGEVQTIHTDHEAGERIENFGGAVALLRYET